MALSIGNWAFFHPYLQLVRGPIAGSELHSWAHGLHLRKLTNMSPKKEPFQKEKIVWTNHQFSGDMP